MTINDRFRAEAKILESLALFLEKAHDTEIDLLAELLGYWAESKRTYNLEPTPSHPWLRCVAPWVLIDFDWENDSSTSKLRLALPDGEERLSQFEVARGIAEQAFYMVNIVAANSGIDALERLHESLKEWTAEQESIAEVTFPKFMKPSLAEAIG